MSTTIIICHQLKLKEFYYQLDLNQVQNGFDKLSKIPLGLLNSHGQLSMTSSSSLQLPNQNENKYILNSN